MPKLAPPDKPAELNLCLQWWGIPGGEMKEKLDFLESSGFGAVEIPSGDWPIKNADAMIEAMKGRKLFLATACGPSDFSYAEPEKREAEVQKFLPIIEALGKMKSVGLIICPARGNLSEPGRLSGKELRKDFVENTGKRLAQHARRSTAPPSCWSRCAVTRRRFCARSPTERGWRLTSAQARP